MIDPNLLRNNMNIVAKQLARRQFKLDTVTLHKYENRRKILQTEIENLQAQRNLKSKTIGIAKIRGDDIQSLCLTVNQINKRLKIIKQELNILQNDINVYLLSIPNLISDEVPTGYNANDNVEIIRWGNPKKYDFSIRDHITLGEISGGLDFAAAVKLTGTRFIVMRGKIAKLHRALTQFMLDLHTEKHGYQEYYLPYLVNQKSLYGTGQLPKFYETLFHIQPTHADCKSNIYSLIPTAEVPLTNLMRNKILEEDELPLKITAHTPCFRSEVGSYGRNIRGLIRMQQFDKVEIVQIVTPETSMKALETITWHAETVLQLLDLPYRKILLCSGDIGFASYKTYDLEVWLPAEKKYKEVSSCSNMDSFQSRRMKIRFRRKKDKKICLVHTLNASGLAVGRTLVAILENYQLPNGSIKIPLVLQPYMNGLTYIN